MNAVSFNPHDVTLSGAPLALLIAAHRSALVAETVIKHGIRTPLAG